MTDTSKPVEEDVRHDDHEFNPSLEPKSAKAWLNLLEESEDAFEDWNDHCDNIDKQYANLERLSQHVARQRISDVLGQLRGAEAVASTPSRRFRSSCRNSRTAGRSTNRPPR